MQLKDEKERKRTFVVVAVVDEMTAFWDENNPSSGGRVLGRKYTLENLHVIFPRKLVPLHSVQIFFERERMDVQKNMRGWTSRQVHPFDGENVPWRIPQGPKLFTYLP